MAGRQQTAPPQQRRNKDATAHPHQPGARQEPPHPDPAHSRRHHPDKAKVKLPLRNKIQNVRFMSLVETRCQCFSLPAVFGTACPPRRSAPLGFRISTLGSCSYEVLSTPRLSRVTDMCCYHKPPLCVKVGLSRLRVMPLTSPSSSGV
jgi:hypothetical protein